MKAFLGSVAAEGAGDEGDVVIDHAEVSSLVGAGFAHGIGEEFAADDDFVAAGGSAFDEGFDTFFGDRAFDEDGGNFVIDEVADEFVDFLNAGFGFGGNSLDATDFEIVGATEV